jgi:hypothetical protein
MPSKSTSTSTTAPAPAAAPPRAPVVFLNPNVLANAVRVGPLSDAASRGVQPGVTSVRDAPAEALVQLLSTAGAQLVCTDTLPSGFDLRDHLLSRGVRGVPFGPDWFACRDRVARGRAVEAWLIRQGGPPAIVIDRPPTVESSAAVGKGARIIAVAIGERAELTGEVCRQALDMLRQPAR